MRATKSLVPLVVGLLVLGLLSGMDYKRKKKVIATGGPPVRIGTPAIAQTNLGTANTGSTSLTVPSDATLVVCNITFYSGTTGLLSGGSLTLNAVALTKVSGGDGVTNNFMGTMFYLLNPATGTQTLAWDWVGTTTLTNAAQLVCMFYKQVHTSTPVRASSCTQALANPKTTATLTALTNDLIVAVAWSYAATNTAFTFTGATLVVDFTQAFNGDQALAEASPTGNQTVSATQTGENNDGGICAVVLRPS